MSACGEKSPRDLKLINMQFVAQVQPAGSAAASLSGLLSPARTIHSAVIANCFFSLPSRSVAPHYDVLESPFKSGQ